MGSTRPEAARSRLAGLLVVAALSVGLGQAARSQGAPGYTLAQLDAAGRALAQEKCHRPVEVKISYVRNPGNREIADEMQSYDCRTFHVAVYRSLSQSPPKELPMSVVLEGAHPLADGTWSVGASAVSIRAALGAPMSVFGENLIYSLSPERAGRDTLTFEISKGVVQVVTWNWEVE